MSISQKSLNEHARSDTFDRAVLTDSIGHDILGPIIQKWLLRLYQYINYYDDGETAFLFCARAGVRIRNLYETFLHGLGVLERPDSDIFWVSRVSACKGVFSRARTRSEYIITQEYKREPIRTLIEGILRHHPDLIAGLDLSRDEYKAHGEIFPGWIRGPTPAAEAIRTYFNQCGSAFDEYLNSLLDKKKRCVLIDSGWQGSLQSLLTTAYPDISWRGLYFGRTLLHGHDPSIVDNVIGLLFESETYIPERPETAFVRHRHIVETLLEPNGPSIEEIPAGRFQPRATALIDRNVNEVLTQENDSLYLGVLRYLDGAGRGASITDIHSRHQASMREMERIIITPTRDEALALICKDRSADFGKNVNVPVLLKKNEGFHADDRIRRSLWHEGQIALEYEGGFARDLQLRAAGRHEASSYFDHASAQNAKHGSKPLSVAVITRTKNRPLLLKRAAEGISRQTYTNYVWVIVNDGGDDHAIRDLISKCSVDRRKIILVSNAVSIGMEAASNAGIRNSQSDLIVIHDDDDSWDPFFLEETVNFLVNGSERYGGVVTGTTYVSEEICGMEVKELSRQPYKDWVRTVHLSEMAAGNIFAPIAFIYRRELWEDIGGYNESLPVLGDWFFNLEFLLRADIGILPKALANYHHRDQGDNSAYANSVIGGLSKHEEFSAIARNEFVRKNASKFPGATAVIYGYFAQDIRAKTDRALPKIENAPLEQASDRYWTILHINLTLKRALLSRRGTSVEATATWPELQTFLLTKGMHIPVPPDFDEERYLQDNHDVAEAVRKGQFPTGYQHYLVHGRSEKRARPHR